MKMKMRIVCLFTKDNHF